MCVFNGWTDADSTVLMGNVVRVGGALHHVTGYENRLRRLDVGPEMIILPVPALPGTMGPHSFLGNEHTMNVMRDMAEALRPSITRTPSSGSKGLLSPDLIQVFEYGPYSLAVGHQVTREGLAAALAQIPPNKVPELNWDILLSFPQQYPGWTLIYGCTDTSDITTMPPFLYHYEPMNSSRVFLPAIDAHRGRPPVPGEPVMVDHTLILGADGGAPVHYQDDIQAHGLGPWLPRNVVGVKLRGITMPNGDFAGGADDLRGNSVRIVRANAPGMTFNAGAVLN